jgi:hypothetical protein
MVHIENMFKILNSATNEKTLLVFCKAYRHKWTGKLMVASEYGYKAWAFYVAEKKSA